MGWRNTVPTNRGGTRFHVSLTPMENRFDLLLVMPYGSCSHKAKMADENCLSLFDDDVLKLDELFGRNHCRRCILAVRN